MKAEISALVDGELERQDAARQLEAMGAGAQAREAWRDYHLIGDAMRGSRMLSPDFSARLAARLAEEPTVLAPRARPVLEQRRWQVLSIAASVAAVAFVVSVAFAPSEDGSPVAPVAQTAKPAETAQVAPPEEADDYLLAHQGYSPRNSLQGMAPYVRTVSSDVRGARR
jgi:sigma-E factor negative regulatory protein RseA